MAQEPTYGFIGIGAMGTRMAHNIRKKMSPTAKLFICDVVQSNLDAFVEKTKGLGPVEIAANPKELTEQCEIIITSLPPLKPIETVFRHPQTGILAAKPGSTSKLFLETSSVEVDCSLALGRDIKKSGLGELADCPVSGGEAGAEQATLSSAVGASKELFLRAKPVLAMMAAESHILHLGPSGSGLAAKIINNYIASAGFIALCEGMNTGVRYGLDPKVLSDLINASSGQSWNSLHMNPVKGVQEHSPAANDFEGGAGFGLAVESTEMAVDLMDKVGAKYLYPEVLRDVWRRAQVNEHTKGKEYRSIYFLFSKDDGKALGTVKVE